MYIKIIHHKKIYYKTPCITLNFEVYLQFLYSMTYLFQHKSTSYVQICKCLLEFFLIN